MKLKKLTALLLTAVMTVSMAACGNGGNSGGNGGNADNSGNSGSANVESDGSGDSASGEKGFSGSTEGTLTVAIWDSNQQKGLQEIIDTWSAQSGVKAQIQVVDWNNYWTLLEAGASGGELPDVFWMHSNQSQKYMENDLLLDLTDKIASSDKIKMDNYYADIKELYTSNDKIYAVPKDIDTIALWYNKAMFDEAGIAYPDDSWTWEDLYTAAEKLTKEDGSQYGFGVNTGNNQDTYYNLIYDYGGYIINDDKSASGYDDAKTIEAMQLIEKMIQNKIVPDLQTMSENGVNVLFESGKIAMCTQGSWMVPEFRDNEYTNKNCDVAVLPKGMDGTRVSIYNGLGWAASSNGKNTDAAWSLIEYLGSEEAQLKQAELGVTMSAFQGTSDAWAKSVEVFNLQAHLDMLNATLILRPYSRSTTTWEDMATEEFKAAWTQDVTMEEACKTIAEKMNAILAEDH